MSDSDYSYNFPTTSTSMLHKPSRRRRSHSPTTKFVLPHHSHSKHHATRASDIARLLDPSYSSSSYAPSAPYVDRHGDLHDPDYRHFPPMSTSPSKLTRPLWETNSYDDVFVVDEDDQDVDTFSTRLDIRKSSERRHRDSVSTYRAPSYSSSFPQSFLTPPTSLESNDTVLEDVDEFPFVDEKEKEKKCPVAMVKKVAAKSRSSKLSKPPIIQKEKVEVEEERHIIEPTSNDPPPEEYNPTTFAQDPEWTPTCSQSLRRQWQSITLSFRLSLFRTQRRLRRTITGS